MPIFGNKPWKAFRRFEEHVADLVGKILPCDRPVVLEGGRGDDRVAYLGLAKGNDGQRPTVALKTAEHGPIQFSFRQELRAEPDKHNGYRLTTKRYWYHLYRHGALEAFMRWEYVDRKIEPEARYPRHHLHIHDVDLPMSDTSAVDLKKAHSTWSRGDPIGDRELTGRFRRAASRNPRRIPPANRSRTSNAIRASPCRASSSRPQYAQGVGEGRRR